jgi:glutaredoxin
MPSLTAGSLQRIGAPAKGRLPAVERLTLLGRPGCHLCEDMARALQPLLAELGLTLQERDVREEPELERRYLFEIPVLLLGTVEVARHRASTAELRERLRPLLHR